MKPLIRLLLADVRLRPGRTALTATAVILSSCIVVWVVSGYDALLAQSIDENAARALGRFDLVVSAGGGPGGGPASKKGERRGGGPAAKKAAKKGERRSGTGIGPGGGPGGAELPPPLIALLQADPNIREADVTTQSRVSVGLTEPTQERVLLRKDRPPVLGMPPLDPFLIGTDAHQPPYEMENGRWLDPNRSTDSPREGVLSAGYARTLQAEVGDELQVSSEAGRWVIQLVGIVEQPGGGGRGGGPGQSGLFVSLALAETIHGEPPAVSRVNLVLQDGVEPAAFGKELSERIASRGATATVVDVQAMRENLTRGLSQAGASILANSATGVALLAALFIIFTTLSMGVGERSRELAVLRAVGLTRGQIASLVFLEGLLLAVLGWLGGLAAGWGLLRVVALTKPDLFPNGAALGFWSVALTAVAAVGGALAASIQPAWRAMRVAPLDAAAPIPTAPPARWLIPAAIVGLALIAINPLIVYLLPMESTTRIWAYATVGCPTMAVGFLLLAPLVVAALEKTAGPAIARILGLQPRLLSSILTANLWRTLGATIALTIGLGLYIATQTWGYSMLVPFTPGAWVPDMLVGFEPSGLPDDRLDAVRDVQGVKPDRVLAMAVEQPKVAGDAATKGGGAGGVIGLLENVVLAGVDPELAFGGDDPMIDLTFVAGDRASALAKLKAGRGCIVPDHVLNDTGLKLGEPLRLILPDGTAEVDYPIVGSVSMPGWHWVTKMTGLRRREVRTGALVFAPVTDVRRDFGITRTNFVWLDAQPGASADAVEAAMQAIAEAEAGDDADGEKAGGKRPYARLTATETITQGVVGRADGMIWGMSQMPLITLLITSLAVVDAVASSVRSRRWELGVQRAVGATRWGLVRQILAEAVLIGLVVLALGFGFGVTAGWCGAGMSRWLSPFGGMPTPLIIPWGRLALGVGLSLGLCLLAALQPAVSAGRAEPAALLQAGRASA